ncbi:MAG TPA: hypothetical protein PLJ89_06765, partial [Thermoleophilia bacterium]|nr:hypothetical protein [Thermoleophilia bacterium]
MEVALKKSLGQFVRFCFVGASGVVVNLAVFTAVLLVWTLAAGRIHSFVDLGNSIVDLAVHKDTRAVPAAAA